MTKLEISYSKFRRHHPNLTLDRKRKEIVEVGGEKKLKRIDNRIEYTEEREAQFFVILNKLENTKLQ